MKTCRYCLKEHAIGMTCVPSCLENQIDKIKAVVGEPSGGQDYADAIIGLLRVARGQRDDYENQWLKLSREIHSIDEAFARRPALADCKTRREKAEAACSAAAKANP